MAAYDASANETLRMKCSFNGTARNVYLPKPVTLAALQGHLHKLYARELGVTYFDEDNDQIHIRTQDDLEHAISLAGQAPVVKLTLTEPVDDEGTASGPGSTASTLHRTPSRMSGDDFFAFQQAEEQAMRKRDNSRPGRDSPPPGHFHQLDRGRSGSTASTRSIFHEISGGGEFIPENMSSNALPPSPGGYSFISEGTHTVRSTGSAHSGEMYYRRTAKAFFDDAESGIDTMPRRAGDFEQPMTMPRTFTDSVRRVRPLDGPQTLPREFSSSMASNGDGFDPLLTTSLRRLELSGQGGSDSDLAALERLHLQHASLEDRKPRRWQKGVLLGSGAFGQVYIVHNVDTGEEMAMKQVALHPEGGGDNTKEVQSLMGEIEVLRALHHERIVQYYGTEQKPDSLCIFMEYVSGRSVAHKLGIYGSFTQSSTRKSTRQILEGLAYLHSHRIVHRDIKGANVLVTTAGDIKLADFGASKKLQAMRTLTGFKSVHGTPFWMAPEVIDGKGYGRRSDIWSVGCTVVEMLTTKPPNSQCEPMAALFKIGSESFDFTATIPPGVPVDCRRFLELCFQRDKAKRPTANLMLQHEFLTVTTGSL